MNNRKSMLAITAGLLSGLVNGNATANTEQTGTQMEEVVVTGQLNRFGATKSALPILETARSISIETEEMFRDKGALTLDDTLNYTAGVVGDTFGFSTRGDFPIVRGFTAAEYRDGQQVLFGYYNNTRSDVYMLEQVEVLKGPASVLYGKGTPGGIVNAISKLAGPEKQNEIVVDYGSNDRKQIAGDFNLALSDNVYIRAVALARDSGTQVDDVDDDNITIMPSITYINETTSLTAMLEYVDRESDTAQQFLPLQSTGCLSGDVKTSALLCSSATTQESNASDYHGNPDFNRYDSESTLLSVLGTHQFSDSFSLESVIRYKEAEVEYRQAWVDINSGLPRVDVNGNGLRTYYLSDNSSEQFAVDLRARWALETGIFKHEIFGGVSYQNVTLDQDFTYLQSQDTFNIFSRENGAVPAIFANDKPQFNSPESNTEEHGIYINDQISVDDLKINVGLRYDDTSSGSAGNTQSDYALSASVGVLYAFDTGISPYVSYAESFEPVVGNDGLTNTPLKPREGEQIEVGIKYQPPGTRTYITLSYFDIEESNLANSASLITEANSQQEGVGEVKGFELEAQTQFGDFGLEVNLTILDTESANGYVFDSVPENQISTWLSYTPSSGALLGFKSGFGVRYADQNESNTFIAGLGKINVTTDGYTLFDAMVGYETQQWDLTLNLRNLSDEEYYGTCLVRGDCFPGEERTAVARVAYKF